MGKNDKAEEEYWINAETGEKYCVDNRAYLCSTPYGSNAGMMQLPPYYGKSYAGHIPLQIPPTDAIV